MSTTEEIVTKYFCDKCQTQLDKEGLWACTNYDCRWCNRCNKEIILAHKHCPKCFAGPKDQTVHNYDDVWRDGDVICDKCNTYVRGYDAG